jgi:hypothetical protein
MLIPCQHCGQQVWIETDSHGVNYSCTRCQKSLNVPVALRSDSVFAYTAPHPDRARRRRLKRIALSVLAVLWLLVLLWWLGREFAPGMGLGKGASVGDFSGVNGGGNEPVPSTNSHLSSPNDSTNLVGTTPSTSDGAGISGGGHTTNPPPAVANSGPNTINLDVSSDFGQRLQRAGAKSGDVQLSLMWNNVNDLDLHCVDPRGEEIFFGHRRSQSGGELDVDMNAGGGLTIHPVENIYWPTGGAPSGVYRVYVNHFANHGARDPTRFVVRILVKGKTMQFNGVLRYGQYKQLVHQFSLDTKS